MKNIGLGLQWMLFMITASIVVPISMADIFSLNPAETATLMQNTMFIVGIGSFLNGIIGHRMPITESPAGIWWSVLVIYSSYVGIYYGTKTEVLRVFYGGMIFSSFLFILLSLTGLIKKAAKLFTPTITFIYLILLSLQLSGIFILRMAGINAKNHTIDPVIAILSITVVFITFYFGSSKIPIIKQFSLIISLMTGWILFAIFGKAQQMIYSDKIFQLPKIFAFGTPKFDLGMVTTSFFVTFMLIMNMFASINTMGNIVCPKEEIPPSKYVKSGLMSGFNQILGAIFNVVGTVPVSSSTGFVVQIGEKSIKPFLLGAVFVSCLSLLPNFMGLMSSLPAAIGYSVSFVLFSKMISMALFELRKIINNVDYTYMVIGISLLAGIGVLFLKPESVKELPSLISSFIGNGLVVGTVLGIILEQGYILKNKIKQKK